MITVAILNIDVRVCTQKNATNKIPTFLNSDFN